jgi:spermidine synthase
MFENTSKSDGTAAYPTLVTLVITTCFFLSGLAGLVYEVVWARQLSLFLGITSYAHTAVITAYMAGLAAGSLYFGRWADRHHEPLKIYAWLEIGVGLYAALTPWLFTALQNGYIAVTDVTSIGTMGGHLTRFVIALLALLIPTFLMGGTLPLLVRGFVSKLPAMGRVTGRFYGINTLGATLGTLLAGYLLIPKLGIEATIFTGVAINLAVAAVVLAMLRQLRQPNGAEQRQRIDLAPSETRQEEPLTPGLRTVLLAGFSTAGFAALLSQMAWIRALILVVGGSVYAFTITLAGFLAGVGLGSLFYTRMLANPRGWLASSWLSSRMAQAALLALMISLALLLGLPVIGKLPGWFLTGYSAGLHANFALFQLFIFALCASVIILPTLLMGILFPLVTAIWTRSVDRAGSGVGTAYAINTMGTILGALLGGLFILPWLGVYYSLMLAVALYALVAIAFWLSSGVSLSKVRQYVSVGLAIMLLAVIAGLIPPWKTMLMTSGVFVNAAQYSRQVPENNLQEVVGRSRLLYYKEGRDGVVAVRRKDDNNALVINGKTDASSKLDLPTQIMLGQLPLAMNPGAKSALVIGLGSGITAGTLASSRTLEKITILEISSEVIEASAFFKLENRAVLDDPRVELVTADARNFLMASREHYDLIISEPSNPWITGISNLFTDEFFKLARSRLNPGGIMTQWFHTYSMSNADLKSILKTFHANFPNVSAWSPVFEDMILIGSGQPHAISIENDAYAAVRAGELRRGNIGSVRDLVRSYIFGGNQLSGYVSNAHINSDTHPVIEFSAPRNLYTQTTQQNMTDIFNYLSEQKVAVPLTKLVRQHSSYLDANFLDLRIANHAQLGAFDIRANWLVSQLLLGSRSRRAHGFVASERMLAWKEGKAEYLIRAKQGFRNSSEMSTTEEPPATGSLEKMRNLKRSATGTDNQQTGNINLYDDINAIWVMGTDDKKKKLNLEMSWDCPARPTGYTRYRLSANLPDVEQEKWQDTVESLASRLQCY